MKIAVTYDNGKVFGHFGHTEQFKVYEVEDEKVIDSKVVGTDGAGHEALASFLFEGGIDVLICGGIGAGAQAALEEAGIKLCSGATGDADDAVEKYLAGELTSAGVNCDHHHEEEHSCGDCGSCGGCHSKPEFEGPNLGKIVTVHYTGTFDNGEKFDSSYDREKPLEFICGAGMMIKGFDAAVAKMNVGDEVDVHLTADEAYGEPDPAAIFAVPIAEMEGCEELNVGEQVFLSNQYGQPFKVTVTAKTDTTITFDANHEMAGKELNFHIELLSAK